MNNDYASNPYFQITDDVADFFGPNLTQFFPEQEGPEDEERPRREAERQRIRSLRGMELTAHVATVHDVWDNGHIKPDGTRWPASGPPWWFPSVALAMRTDLFRDQDLQVFVGRAHLEAMRALERLTTMADTSEAVAANAGAEFDAEVVRLTAIADAQHGEELDFNPNDPFNISREGWINYAVTEWKQSVMQYHAVPTLVRVFVEAMETVLAVRGKPVAYKAPVSVSLDALCCWWRERNFEYAGNAPGSVGGLKYWIRDNPNDVLNTRKEAVTELSIDKTFTRSGDIRDPSIKYSATFQALDSIPSRPS